MAVEWNEERFYVGPAACFVRGSRPDAPADLTDEDVCEWGLEAGVRLHRFKRKLPLPRVERVLGALAQFQPVSLLDVGSGRGTFLWPLLDRFADLEVTAVEPDPPRAELLAAVAAGGLSRLEVIGGDVSTLVGDVDSAGRWDVVTVLEVLEHVEDPAPVAKASVMATRSVVIASVPSVPDDNPGHVRLFDRASLTELFMEAGATRVSVDQVRGHLIAVVSVDGTVLR